MAGFAGGAAQIRQRRRPHPRHRQRGQPLAVGLVQGEPRVALRGGTDQEAQFSVPGLDQRGAAGEHIP